MCSMRREKKDIDTLFERGVVAEVIPSREELEKHLLAQKPLHIYLGIDPTHHQVHLGHIQHLLFLEDLRKLGTRITVLFGSFTGLIGDPTGKEQARKQLTPAQINRNMKTWKKQIAPVLNLSLFGGARIQRNNRWFDIFSLYDFLCMMRETTVQQLLERDMFEKRLKSGKPLYTHELMYPLLQGYDSVALKVDAELCGTDQTFNALMGRTMARRYLDKEKFVIALNLIEGDGVLMSKSTGTGVFVNMESGGNHAMYGSIMALPDSFINPLFRGCTRIPMQEIATIDTSGGVATRNAKMQLAREIVAMFWGATKAEEAQKDYQAQFQDGGVPDGAPTITIQDGDALLAIVAEHAASSRADAKRKFEQGAVTLGGEKIHDLQHTVKKGEKQTLRVGRKAFFLL